MSTSEHICSVCGEEVPLGAPVIFHRGEVVHLTCYILKAAESRGHPSLMVDSQPPPGAS